jgi:formylglycine-generating enzyme required for sulfatase activity
MKLVDGGSFTPAQRESLTARYRDWAGTGKSSDFSFDLAPFCLSVLETTQAEFHECIAAGACVGGRDFQKSGGPTPQPCESADEACEGELATQPAWAIYIAGARAYCAFRGGRVPTITEWFWAASGGDEARTYPWGDAKPTNRHLNVFDDAAVRYQCCWEPPKNASTKACAEPSCLRGYRPLLHTNDGHSSMAPVGSYPEGAGRWGHLDLLGNVAELVSLEHHERACGANAQTQADETDLDLDKHECAASPSSTLRGIRCAAEPRP